MGNESQTETDVSSVLSAYKSEGDPELYEEAYMELKKFVEGSLDIYKHELGMILYPVLVHMYLELVYNGHSEKAVALMQKFGAEQDPYYQDDLRRLAQVTANQIQRAITYMQDALHSTLVMIYRNPAHYN